MDKLRKLTVICFLFAVWIFLSAILSLSLSGGKNDPVRDLVSQSCIAVKQFFSPDTPLQKNTNAAAALSDETRQAAAAAE